MTPFLTLLSREIRTRWMLLAAALAMGTFIALISLVPSSRGTRPEELRTAVGPAIGLLWATLIATGLGATCFARDLGERRLAFDFRLPASATAIWGARLLGAYLVVLLGGLLVLLPLAPLGVDFSAAAEVMGSLGGWLPLFLAVLLMVSHLGGMALYGRRSWTGADLASVTLVGGATAQALHLLDSWNASDGEVELLVLAGGLLLAALVIATWVQLRVGRSEVDRGHAALALTLLGLTLIPAAAALAYARWYVSPSPKDLIGRYTEAVGLGDQWVALEGLVERPDAQKVQFLLHPRTGRALRTDHGRGYVPTPTPYISRDGSTLVWLERKGWSGTRDLELLTLEARQADARPSRSPISWQFRLVSWDISSDANLVATIQDIGDRTESKRLVVEEIASGAVRLAMLLPECRGQWDKWEVIYGREDRLFAVCNTATLQFKKVTDTWLYLEVDVAGQRLLPTDASGLREALDEPDQTGEAETVVRDADGKWLWRDPATADLVPLLDDAQYGPRRTRADY